MVGRSAAKKPSAALVWGLPFMAFMFMGWYGLASVIQTKRELRGASRGIDAVEEMDPVERMRQRYGLTNGGGASGNAGAPRRAAAASSSPTEIRTLEDELAETLKQLDIHNFDYKPVPRPSEEDS